MFSFAFTFSDGMNCAIKRGIRAESDEFVAYFEM